MIRVTETERGPAHLGYGRWCYNHVRICRFIVTVIVIVIDVLMIGVIVNVTWISERTDTYLGAVILCTPFTRHASSSTSFPWP